MNITALDDWVRLHGLPAKTAVQHFEPVLQLLQWLQTQSNIHAFDDLIGTVQGLRRLNPLQMRRAVRDYKFEVSEGRMDDECVAYMGQIQKDWENRRVQTSVKALKAEQEGGKEVGRPGTSVDALFDGSVSLADFVPSSGPESYGELLDSRFMLPFQLPDDPNYLIATPAQEAIYTNFTASSPFLSDDRSASRTSFSSTRRFEYTLPSRDKLRRIPDDFFAWLKAQEAGRHHSAQSVRTPASMSSAVMPAALDLPLGQSDQAAIHSSRSSMASPKLPSVQENGSFGPPPIRPVSISSTLHSSLLPAPGIRTSPLVNQVPDQAQVPSQPAPQFRSDSYEIRLRRAVHSVHEASDETRSTASNSTSRLVSPPGSPRVPSRHPSRPLYPESRSESVDTGSGENGARSETPPSPTDSKRSAPLMSPSSIASPASESGKKKWWKVNRKEGSGNSDRDGSEEGGGSVKGILRRKASAITLGGKGILGPKSPETSKRPGIF
jgi:hypothetical protein